MRLQLPELQAQDRSADKTSEQSLADRQKDIEKVLHREDLLYMPVIIKTELISGHYEHSPTGHFGIKQIRKLITRKYY